MKKITQIWRKFNLAKLITVSFVFLILLGVGLLIRSNRQIQTEDIAKITKNTTPTESDQAKLSDSYGKLPLSFEVNQGQTDEQVKFLSRSSGHSVFLTSGEIVTTMRKPSVDEQSVKPEQVETQKQETVIDSVLRMKFVGGNSQPAIAGMDELPGKVNYFTGNDSTKWHSAIPTYGKVKYTEVYPDIDAVFYGNQRNLEFDFIVSPGADPKKIELAFDNAAKIEVSEKGELVLNIADEQMNLKEPIIYQEIEGKRQSINGGFVLNPKTGDSELPTVGFRVDDYDSTKPLIIDPILVYSTYLGGSDGDSGNAIATDGIGHAFVTGSTDSADFPTANALQPERRESADVFVTKFYGDGSALIYSTYLGGNNSESGKDITVDTAGNVYLTGSTNSLNFPMLNAAQPIFGGMSDAFVTKLNSAGSALIFSTFLGGNRTENINGGSIAIDAAANVYVTGETASTNFPTTLGGFQTTYGGGFSDAFVTKLNAAGSNINYSTFLGGSNSDFGGTGIAVDVTGNAYVSGYTQSANFSTTPSSFQPNFGGDVDAFVTKFNPSGSALVFSTFLGGQSSELALGITLDAQNQVYVTGGSRSTNFPTTPGAFQTTYAGGDLDIFVTKLNSIGSGLVYSTYIGGTSNLVNGDIARSIAIDSEGNAYVTGETTSADFPTVNPFQLFRGGRDDAFVLKLNTTGSALIYSTYLGGTGQDRGQGIALDNANNAYVTGITDSLNFHVNNAFQPNHGGGQFDAFVSKIADPVVNKQKRNNLDTFNQK